MTGPPIQIDKSLKKWYNLRMGITLGSIEAIYEGGVLKPLGPTDFKEGDKVRLIIEPSDGLNQSWRLPDPPFIDEADIAPIDLPRDSGKSVRSQLGSKRLPDGVGF